MGIFRFLPQFVLGIDVQLRQFLPLLPCVILHPCDPFDELFTCTLHQFFRLKMKEPADIYDGEKKISVLLLLSCAGSDRLDLRSPGKHFGIRFISSDRPE